jgi:hypothetical protein
LPKSKVLFCCYLFWYPSLGNKYTKPILRVLLSVDSSFDFLYKVGDPDYKHKSIKEQLHIMHKTSVNIKAQAEV